MGHRLKDELYRLVQQDSTIFDFIQSTSMDGLWYWDVDKPEEEWMNERFWEVLGYPASEKKHLVSEWQALLIDPEGEFNKAYEALEKHFQDPDVPFDQILKYRHGNGSTVWIRVRGVAIRDDTGKPIRLLGTHTDITAGVRLNEHESLLNTAMKALPVGLIIADMNGSFLEVNGTLAELLGYTIDEMRGMSVFDIAPDCELERTRKIFSEVPVDNFEVIGLEKQYKRKDGSVVWCTLNSRSVRDESSKSLFIVSSLMNIQHEKTLRLQIKQQNQELTAANQELDQFAYIASHDLKSPLSGIRKLANWISDDCQDILPKDSQRHLEMLGGRIDRMEQLLDDLLAYSRIGRKNYALESVSLKPLVSSIFQMQDAAEGFKCSADDVRCKVWRIPFETVLRNLISNSIKHNKAKAGSIAVHLEKSDEEYILTVEDDGPGIVPEYHEKALQMFQTLQSRDIVEGSGLGLALVKKTVESFQGSLAIESDGVKGMKVIARWPRP